MTAYREFTYVQDLKRFGLNVAKKLEARALAIYCPACPLPEVNMDPDWQKRPKNEW